jgi:hypothetical protein
MVPSHERQMGSRRGLTSVQQLHVQVAAASFFSSLPSAVFSLLSVLAGAPKKKPVAGACLGHQTRQTERVSCENIDNAMSSPSSSP